MGDAQDTAANRSRVLKILEENESLDFVKRILSPEKYPRITSEMDERLEPGQEASHQMSWSQNGPDGEATEFYVYPNIVHSEGRLDWLDPDKAHDYAVKSGERIVFDNKEDAIWFSGGNDTETKKLGYKSIWPEK